MRVESLNRIHPGVLAIQRELGKIDRLRLPIASCRDVERILVRQVTKELDRALPWQAGHGRRTATIALAVGREIGLSSDDLHHLTLAAYLHDIGLLMLPPGLMDSTTFLEPDTYVAVQNHCRIGAALLEPYAFLEKAAILVAYHHERWDGTGYPYGIRGPFIPLGARILSVADAFDAIQVPEATDSTLRDLIASRILHVAAGTQFDPTIVAALMSCLKHRNTDGDRSGV
ncbi:MAG: HD domain-containing phosphohydrolase [Nitrospira sp.]|nr:HD domain-containing phosphohydrolase [Nitrospira sp.]